MSYYIMKAIVIWNFFFTKAIFLKETVFFLFKP